MLSAPLTLLILALSLVAVGMARIEQEKFSLNWNPTWVADYLSRDHLLPGGVRLDPSAFPRLDDAEITTTAAADAGDETLSVQALSAPLPAGSSLTADGGSARIVRAAPAGATQLAVSPLDNAIATGATLSYSGNGRRLVLAGTLVGRTYDERAQKAPFGPADLENDDEIHFLVHDVQDVSRNADAELLRTNTLLKENFIPGWETRSAAEKAWIRDNHPTTIGQA